MRGARRRDFWIFWLGQFVSSAGDQMFFSVLLFLVLLVETSHGGTKAGLVSFLETLPYLLLGPFVGALVDRFPKRRVMIASDLLRMLVLLAFWPLYFTHHLHWWSIGALAFLHTSFSALFLPARDAFMPRLAGDWLFRANALLQGSTQLAWVVGAVAAGLLIGPHSTVSRLLTVLTVDALTFWASVVAIWRIRVPEPPPQQRDFLEDVRQGLRLARQHAFLRRLLVLTALDNLFIMGPAIVGANLLVKRVFDLGAAHLAFFEGAMGLGWFLGTLWLYRSREERAWHYLVFGILMDGATYLPFLWIRQYSVALGAILFHGFFIPWITVSRTTLLQRLLPEVFLGRVFAFVNLTVLGATALSSFFTGVLGDWVPVPYVFFLPGVLGTLSGVLAYFWLPRVRPGARIATDTGTRQAGDGGESPTVAANGE